MTDDEFEEWLARYRPAGSPPALRSRILRGRDRRGFAVPPWMPAAAAVLAAAAFYWLSARERAIVHLNFDRTAVARAANIELVSRSLGGGTQSLLAAEFVVLLDEPKTPEPGR